VAWAIRHAAGAVALLVDQDHGRLARRAERLEFPVRVWAVDGRRLVAADPEPLPIAPQPDPEHVALMSAIAAAGATPIVEHGVVIGEICGLEVCRVVDQPTTGHLIEFSDPDLITVTAGQAGGPVGDQVGIEVGVGPNDREAFRLLHGHLPTPEALAQVVRSVADHRRVDAPQHPLNRLARERFVRWRLEQEPDRCGLALVVPASPPVPRPGLNAAEPCLAGAVDHRGRAIQVVCSSGIDLDLVGFVADVQPSSDDPVMVVIPSRDRVAVTEDLLGLLAEPVQLVTID
jgi:hypothetical protein